MLPFFASPWTKCYCATLFSHTQNYRVYTKYTSIKILVLLLWSTAVLFVQLFFVFSPRLIKFSVHGTISSYVVFQNIVIRAIAVLTVDLLSPSQLLSVHVVCKGLEFRVWFEAFYGNDHGKRKHIHH